MLRMLIWQKLYIIIKERNKTNENTLVYYVNIMIDKLLKDRKF